MRAKAAEFNEDEFAHGMLSRRMSSKAIGQEAGWSGLRWEGDRGNKALSVDAVRLLKTKLLDTLRTKRSVALKEVKRREERLALAAALVSNDGHGDGGLDDGDDDDDDFDEDEEPGAKSRGSDQDRVHGRRRRERSGRAGNSETQTRTVRVRLAGR